MPPRDTDGVGSTRRICRGAVAGPTRIRKVANEGAPPSLIEYTPGTGNTVSRKAQPAHAQAQAACCTDEYGDCSDALFAYNGTYAGRVAACGITGIGGCAVGLTGLDDAAWFRDNTQEALQECVMENMANAGCSLAGFLRAAPLHETKKASPWRQGRRCHG